MIYKVSKIIKINPDEINYFYETKNKILTLVTCADKNKKRLLIISDLQITESLIK